MMNVYGIRTRYHYIDNRWHQFSKDLHNLHISYNWKTILLYGDCRVSDALMNSVQEAYYIGEVTSVEK